MVLQGTVTVEDVRAPNVFRQGDQREPYGDFDGTRVVIAERVDGMEVTELNYSFDRDDQFANLSVVTRESRGAQPQIAYVSGNLWNPESSRQPPLSALPLSDVEAAVDAYNDAEPEVEPVPEAGTVGETLRTYEVYNGDVLTLVRNEVFNGLSMEPVSITFNIDVNGEMARQFPSLEQAEAFFDETVEMLEEIRLDDSETTRLRPSVWYVVFDPTPQDGGPATYILSDDETFYTYRAGETLPAISQAGVTVVPAYTLTAENTQADLDAIDLRRKDLTGSLPGIQYRGGERVPDSEFEATNPAVPTTPEEPVDSPFTGITFAAGLIAVFAIIAMVANRSGGSEGGAPAGGGPRL